jgi:dihydropyrimidinase
MSTIDLRIRNASVVLSDGPRDLDILVDGGKITGVVPRTDPTVATEEIDATGLHVFPGLVDPHVHLGPNITYPQSAEDVARETQSAAAGGITTLIAYLMTPQPYEEVFPIAKAAMEADSAVDFGFHFCVVTRDQLESMPDYVRDLGVSSFKFFMNFRGDEGKYLDLPGNDDGFMFDLLEAAERNGAMLDPHAENIELVWRLRALGRPEGVNDLDAWNLGRPDYVEAEALHRLSFLAKVTGASVYAVHTTSGLSLDVLRQGQQSHPDLFVETCPHYLTLDINAPCGTYGKVNPPLRPRHDLDALWSAVADGLVDTIGSDHVPRHKSFKEKDIMTASAGFPGMQNLLPLLISEGYHKRNLPLERIAYLTSTRPAQLFGLYPKKGVIHVGSDADLTLVDLSGQADITAATQLSGAEYTPWEGWHVEGVVARTIRGGESTFANGAILPSATGKFLHREHSGRAALDAIA